MTMPDATENLRWWQQPYPTEEEKYLSGGLEVEDWPHARQVARLATQLFAATYPLHHLSEKELRLLERAAFLHNTGMTIAVRRHHKHSFRLIKEAQLPDFTDKERYEIACIARYHRRALPSNEHQEYAALSKLARQRVSKLAALLRIADAFDYNHDGRVIQISVDPANCNEKSWTFLLTIRPLSDLDTELEHAHEKADLFEKVFGCKAQFLFQEQQD